MALILSRRRGESVIIGGSILRIVAVHGNRMTFAVEAPDGVCVQRGEIEKPVHDTAEASSA
jgi:carbon storage regulator CsrA